MYGSEKVKDFYYSLLERDVAQWLEHGALPKSLPLCIFEPRKALYPYMLHLTQV